MASSRQRPFATNSFNPRLWPHRLQLGVSTTAGGTPLPYSLPFGMASSMAGLLTLAFAPNYGMLLVGGMLLGLGSSIFHPESSRVARLASGGAHGLAQALFQVG